MPEGILVAGFSATLGLLAWILKSLTDGRTDVAVVKVKVETVTDDMEAVKGSMVTMVADLASHTKVEDARFARIEQVLDKWAPTVEQLADG